MARPEFDDSTIRALATSTSYDRGEEYMAYGVVHNLVLEGETYRAHVYGSSRYTVRVWDDEGDVEASCTCPYDWGGVCKHIVAVMLTILEQEEEGETITRVDAPPPAPEPEASVQLDDILTTLLSAEPDGKPLTDLEFKNFFALLIVAGNETNKISSVREKKKIDDEAMQ